MWDSAFVLTIHSSTAHSSNLKENIFLITEHHLEVLKSLTTRHLSAAFHSVADSVHFLATCSTVVGYHIDGVTPFQSLGNWVLPLKDQWRKECHHLCTHTLVGLLNCHLCGWLCWSLDTRDGNLQCYCILSQSRSLLVAFSANSGDKTVLAADEGLRGRNVLFTNSVLRPLLKVSQTSRDIYVQ